MKRIYSLLVLLALFLAVLPIPAQASETRSTVVYFEDGSYLVTEITESNNRMLTKVGTKTNTRYDANDVIQWKMTVTGEFLYDGTSVTCTYATGTTTIYNHTNWYMISDSATYGGTAATYLVTFGSRNLGITIGKPSFSLTLYCDENGNLS